LILESSKLRVIAGAGKISFRYFADCVFNGV